jgi:hypothetical protein
MIERTVLRSVSESFLMLESSCLSEILLRALLPGIDLGTEDTFRVPVPGTPLAAEVPFLVPVSGTLLQVLLLGILELPAGFVVFIVIILLKMKVPLHFHPPCRYYSTGFRRPHRRRSGRWTGMR